MASGAKNSRTKHLPQRTCIACRQTNDKRSFIRIVHTHSGIVEVDTSGTKPGRGAYLCTKRACWEAALKKNRVDYSLRTRLSDDNRRALSAYSESSLEESRT